MQPTYGPSHHSLQDRIGNLRQRLRKPGPQPHAQHKLQNLRARSYLQKQKKSIQLPFDAAKDTTVSGLRNTYQQTLSSLAGQEANTRQAYGFDDTSNPYSIANQLQTNYNQRKAGTLNSRAAAGQLYSGSTQTALEGDRTAYLQGTDSAIRDYQAKLASIQSNRAKASDTLTQGEKDAYAKALEDAANAPLDPSQAPSNPKFVRKYLKRMSHHASQLAKHGHKKKAEKIRERLATEQ